MTTRPRLRFRRRQPCWHGPAERRESWPAGPISWSSCASICGTPTSSWTSSGFPSSWSCATSPAKGFGSARRSPATGSTRTPRSRPPIPPGRRGADHGRLADSEPGQRGRQPVQLVARRPTRFRPLIALDATVRDRRARRDPRGPRRDVLHGAGQERARARRDPDDDRLPASSCAQRLGLRAIHPAQRDGHRRRRRGVVGAARRRPEDRSRRRAWAWPPSPRRRASRPRPAAGWRASPPPRRPSPAAGELAGNVATPISDMRGTAEYRLHLVGVSPGGRWRGRSSGRERVRQSSRRSPQESADADQSLPITRNPSRVQEDSRHDDDQRRAAEFLCEPRQSLLEVLRDTLRLTGAKEGCNNGNCGACTVILDGVPVNSCLVLAVEAEGADDRDRRRAGRARATCTRSSSASWKAPPCSAASARPASSSPPRRCWTGTRTRPSTRSASTWPTTSAAARATTRS